MRASAVGPREIAVAGGVERRAVRVARPGRIGRRPGDLGAAEEGRIDQPHAGQLRQCGGVVVHVLGLAAHGRLPCQAEPAQVVVYRRLVFRPAAGAVDVLDAQQEAAPGGAAAVEIGQRREGVAEMQRAVRRRREAENGLRGRASGLIAHATCFSSVPSRGPIPCAPSRRAEDIAEGLAHLAKADRRLKPVIRVAGTLGLRRRAPGFAGLARIIVGQQLSVASANAIWERFVVAFPEMTPDAIHRAREPRFRKAGMSAPKIRALRAAAAACRDGLDLDALADQPAEAAHARLCEVHGIGPWTADIYLLFCLGHPDIFPVGDLALRNAVADAFAMETAGRAGRDRRDRGKLVAVAWRCRLSVLGLLQRAQGAEESTAMTARRMRLTPEHVARVHRAVADPGWVARWSDMRPATDSRLRRDCAALHGEAPARTVSGSSPTAR